MKTKHIFAGGMRIAQISNGVRYYHHKDHLGSTLGVTNDAGTLVWKSDYQPYGLPRSTWWAQPSIDSLIRHRFTDQEYDPETKLYNYNARLYDPSIARFISPDTIVDNPYSSLALNRYMYVAGNPLRYTDPSGHFRFKIGGWKIRGSDSTLAMVAGVALFGGGFLLYDVGYVLTGKAMMYAGVAAIGYGVEKKGGNVDVRGNASIDSKGNVSIGGSGGGGSGGSGGTGGSASSGQYVGGPHSSQTELIDVDPNGELFENPTGEEMRGCDSQGCGYYGARRDGGTRPHLGIDIESNAGQNIVAPFSGRANVIRSEQYPGVRISGTQYTADILYMKSSNSISNAGTRGLMVNKGEFIGTALNITGRYPNITNHIHFQMRNNSSPLFVNPTPFMFSNRR